MTVKIGSNITSLTAQRNLAKATSEIGGVYERLSSGLRINRASDDAASLAVAETLSADSRVFRQGVRNLNDGISAISIADSAIEQLTSISVRIRELASQSANGTYSKTQRAALDAEAQSLSSEYYRISKTTKFNGINLLDGSSPAISLQAGYGSNGVLATDMGGTIGAGTFGASVSYSGSGTTVNAISLGDFNGDGILDIVNTDSSGPILYVRAGTGSGTFATAVSYNVGVSALNAVSTGDINNDGYLDIVAGGSLSNVVLLGTGTGSFGSAVTYVQTTEGTSTLSISLGDINNDGALDLVYSGNGGRTAVRLNNGSGTFGSVSTYSYSAGTPTAVKLADLNNDGNLDLLTAGGNGSVGNIDVRFGTGGGTFSSATSYVYVNGGSTAYAISVGDVNNDGQLDLLAAGLQAGGGYNYSVRLGAGAGTFGAATSFVGPGTYLYGASLNDLNGDGNLDIIVGGGSGGVSAIDVALGNGNGTFGTVVSYTNTSGNGLTSLALGDLNSDGVLDIVSGNQSTSGYLTTRLGQTQSGTAPLLNFSLKTKADALQSFGILDNKINSLTIQRGTLGAHLSRLDTAVSHLSNLADNYVAADSRIRDADIASDSASLIRLQVLREAGTAILAQANQQPALVLKLLVQDQ